MLLFELHAQQFLSFFFFLFFFPCVLIKYHLSREARYHHFLKNILVHAHAKNIETFCMTRRFSPSHTFALAYLCLHTCTLIFSLSSKRSARCQGRVFWSFHFLRDKNTGLCYSREIQKKYKSSHRQSDCQSHKSVIFHVKSHFNLRPVFLVAKKK